MEGNLDCNDIRSTNDITFDEILDGLQDDPIISNPGITRIGKLSGKDHRIETKQTMKLSDALEIIRNSIEVKAKEYPEGLQTTDVEVLCSICRGGDPEEQDAKGSNCTLDLGVPGLRISNRETTFSIPVKSFRVSCSSDLYHTSANYAGIVVYDLGKLKPSCITTFKPGYVYIRKSEEKQGGQIVKLLEDCGPGNGMVHGGLMKKFTDGKFDGRSVRSEKPVVVGFAFINFQTSLSATMGFAGKSGVFNVEGPWMDGNREMKELEHRVIKHVVNEWMNGGPGCIVPAQCPRCKGVPCVACR